MKLRTGISPNYVKGWDITQALREIIQNYLDTLQEFKCRGRITWANGYATVKDNGPGLEMKHLALGISEKSDMAKGQFGEGLKLALLVLAREKRKVEIQTQNQVIQPEILHDPHFDTEILALDVEPSKQAFQGTTIRVKCSQGELDAAKAYFVEFADKNQFSWVEKDKISTPGGFLYLNGTRIGRIPNAIFSYHLNGKWSNLGNRDREVINMHVVRPAIKEILSTTKSTQVISTVLKKLLEKTSEDWEEIWTGIDYYSIPPAQRKVWKKTFLELCGDKAVLEYGDYAINLGVKELGYNVVYISSYSWRAALALLGIPRSIDVKINQSAKSTKVPVNQWTEEETKNFRTARRLIKKHYHDPEKVTVVTEIKGLAAHDEDVKGMYDGAKDRIYLKRDVLSSLEDTLNTMLHETVHKYSGADDNTRAFEDAILSVAVGMMLKKGGKKP